MVEISCSCVACILTFPALLNFFEPREFSTISWILLDSLQFNAIACVFTSLALLQEDPTLFLSGCIHPLRSRVMHPGHFGRQAVCKSFCVIELQHRFQQIFIFDPVNFTQTILVTLAQSHQFHCGGQYCLASSIMRHATYLNLAPSYTIWVYPSPCYQLPAVASSCEQVSKAWLL